MIRRRRIRSIVKWTGAVVTMLLLVVWMGSAWWGATVWLSPRGAMGIDQGQIWLELVDTWRDDIRIEWRGIRMHGIDFKWWFEFLRWEELTLVRLPVWPIVLPTGVPTAWMFRTNWKRRRAGLCPKCSYDLRGQGTAVSGQKSEVSGARAGCPECGWGRGEEGTEARRHEGTEGGEP